jgi:hypothetical protein
MEISSFHLLSSNSSETGTALQLEKIHTIITAKKDNLLLIYIIHFPPAKQG